MDQKPARKTPIGLAITGASGAQYGLRLLQCLLNSGQHVQLMVSSAARVVINTETELALPGHTAQIQTYLSSALGTDKERLTVYGKDQWMAPLASGSNAPRAMVICPCSSATLSAVAHGASRSLIERAADVMIKERRPLILVTRETPVSPIHLENMLSLARLGVTILPASPGFYHRPQDIGGLVDFVVARILDHLQIEHHLIPRWGEALLDDRT